MATLESILKALQDGDERDGTIHLSLGTEFYDRSAVARAIQAFSGFCTALVVADNGESLWLDISVVPDEQHRRRQVLGDFLNLALCLSYRDGRTR